MTRDEALRRELQAAGCIDVDAAITLGDWGDVDAASAKAAVAAFKTAKGFIFKEPAPKSALDMTEAEYQASVRKMVMDGDLARCRPPMHPGTDKSALDMTPEEYRQALWKMGARSGF
ncbi:MAG TPA: hypothetical protein VH913_16875 [Hyphomicrobiaceae bacterium]|jgi:hypothetical protein